MKESFFSKFVLSDARGPRFLRHLVFWVAAWAFQGFIYGFYFLDGQPVNHFRVSFIESLIYLPQHMFLTYAIIYYVLPQYVFKGLYWKGLVGVLVLITIAAAFSPITNKFVTVPLRQSLDFSFISKPVFYSFLGGLRGSTTVAGFATAIKLVKVWYLKTEENKQLERGKLNAELEVLKNQLHPHFLFNTLNSIYLQALKGSAAAAPAIEKLSALLRYILTECKQPSIPLANEIRMLRNYIDLEKNRFGKRLDIVMTVHGDVGHNTIAPLVLLPFLENAFKHGTGKALDQAWISVDIAVTNNELTVKLINAKSDADSGVESPGIGLNNVRKRLELLYGGRHELNILDTDDMFVVDLKLSLDHHVTPAPIEDKVSLG